MGRRELLRIDAKVEVEYKSFDQFYTEYTKNISKGGVFIRTDNIYKPQTVLEILLKLPGTEPPLSLVGEVVHVIDKDTAKERGIEPGMGVQFVDFEEGAHQSLDIYVASRIEKKPESLSKDRRRHARVPVRLRVKFPSVEVLQQDYSEDISRGGIFIQTQKPKEVGDRFLVTLVHPETKEEIELMGEVVRVAEGEPHIPGSSKGMGIKFIDMDKEKKEAIRRFLGFNFPKVN